MTDDAHDQDAALGRDDAFDQEDALQQLAGDWAHERAALEDKRLQVAQSPREALGADTVDRLITIYREAGARVGRLRLSEAASALLERHIAALKSHANDLRKQSATMDEAQREARGQAIEQQAADMIDPIHYNLRLVRELLGLTDADFAQLSGLSRSSIYSLERGKTLPRATTIYQVALSAGVHPTVLMTGCGEIDAWGRILAGHGAIKSDLAKLASSSTSPEHDASGEYESFTSTIDEMNQMFDDEHPDGWDPADWMTELEDAILEVARRGALSSTPAAIGAAIGRQWAGLYGALVVAHMAHAHAPLIQFDNLGGFRVPGPFIERRIRYRLPEGYDLPS
jgi:transcriptional regulator with XRE-family HTH domain